MAYTIIALGCAYRFIKKHVILIVFVRNFSIKELLFENILTILEPFSIK